MCKCCPGCELQKEVPKLYELHAVMVTSTLHTCLLLRTLGKLDTHE